jgi:hypothetical protein
MIQLNLLPDVKLEYLKAQRMRRLAMAISFLITAAAIAILVLLLIVEGFQKHHLTNLNNNVSTDTITLQKEPQINNILTVQNQLNSVNTLHASKPAATKLFDYMNELTPTSITVSELTIDFNAHTISITGSAPSLSSVDQYIDTLKFTTYTTGPRSGNNPAFSNVVLGEFSLSNTSTPPASYTITASFDPAIFNITKNVSLVIPTTITTRSAREDPAQLFVKGTSSKSNTSSTGGGN